MQNTGRVRPAIPSRSAPPAAARSTKRPPKHDVCFGIRNLHSAPPPSPLLHAAHGRVPHLESGQWPQGPAQVVPSHGNRALEARALPEGFPVADADTHACGVSGHGHPCVEPVQAVLPNPGEFFHHMSMPGSGLRFAGKHFRDGDRDDHPSDCVCFQAHTLFCLRAHTFAPELHSGRCCFVFPLWVFRLDLAATAAKRGWVCRWRAGSPADTTATYASATSTTCPLCWRPMALKTNEMASE